MRVYAFIGDSGQTIVPNNFNYQPQENEILMKTERPDGDYVAKEDGTWEKVVPVIAPTDMERVEAQVMYTALLTDTLLPEVE